MHLALYPNRSSPTDFSEEPYFYSLRGPAGSRLRGAGGQPQDPATLDGRRWRRERRWAAGGGEVASADGMRLVTPVRTINAGPNRKYFGSGRGITWYNFVSDQYSGFHGIVIPGTLRDSIFVLEGLPGNRRA